MSKKLIYAKLSEHIAYKIRKNISKEGNMHDLQTALSERLSTLDRIKNESIVKPKKSAKLKDKKVKIAEAKIRNIEALKMNEKALKAFTEQIQATLKQAGILNKKGKMINRVKVKLTDSK